MPKKHVLQLPKLPEGGEIKSFKLPMCSERGFRASLHGKYIADFNSYEAAVAGIEVEIRRQKSKNLA